MSRRPQDAERLAALGRITAMLRDKGLADLRRATAAEAAARAAIAALRPIAMDEGMDAASHARFEAARLVRLGEANMALARARADLERARIAATRCLGRDEALSRLEADITRRR
jgi:hypothetical protein